MKNHSDAATQKWDLGIGNGGYIAAVDENLALGRRFLTEYEFQKSRFAGSAGTGQKDEIPLLHFDGDVGQSRRVSIVLLGDVERLNQAGSLSPGPKTEPG